MTRRKRRKKPGLGSASKKTRRRVSRKGGKASGRRKRKRSNPIEPEGG